MAPNPSQIALFAIPLMVILGWIMDQVRGGRPAWLGKSVGGRPAWGGAA